MSDAPRLTSTKAAERAARDRRLAEALRANLRRRKEQARAHEDEATKDRRAPNPAEPRG